MARRRRFQDENFVQSTNGSRTQVAQVIVTSFIFDVSYSASHCSSRSCKNSGPGSHLVLISSTGIPLVMDVRTNVCSQVVGSFVIQYENIECITEALMVFKEWNKDTWTPSRCMVDFAEEEIQALETVFPGIILSCKTNNRTKLIFNFGFLSSSLLATNQCKLLEKL